MVSRKPTGSLLLDDLRPAKHLYLLSSGTGLAPFLSLSKDPQAYERFAKVILVHGVRQISDLAYSEYLTRHIFEHEFLGDVLREKLIYYPTVTREPFRNRGRLTDLIESGRLFEEIGMQPLNPACDRVMVCGSPGMLADTCSLLDARGFEISEHIGAPGDYVVERAFVEK
jgi:ferredoxin/flavodoxin---NADP+ reductase